MLKFAKSPGRKAARLPWVSARRSGSSYGLLYFQLILSRLRELQLTFALLI